MKKKIFTVTLCILLILLPLNISANEVYTATIVFLGDSIANGAMLADKKTERYSTLIGNKMNAEIINHAVDGMNSSSLILALNSGAYDAALAKADYVSISIGSNDLLLPFVDIVKNLFGSSMTLPFNQADFTNMAAKINDAITGNETLIAACNAFGAKLNAIVSIVKDKSPKAEILVNNIYNPYVGISINFLGTEYLNLEAKCEYYVKLINKNFSSKAWTYTLINLYKIFSEGGLSNAKFDLLQFEKSDFDPHPNKNGHAAIAEAILDVIDIMPHPVDIADHWGENYIRAMIHKGLFSGLIKDNKFEPDTPMTRGMFVTVFGRLINADVSGYKDKEPSFTDVVAKAYYAPYIAWAADKKLVFGIGDDLFSPDTPIKREDMAVILQRCIINLKLVMPTDLTAPAEFSDAEAITAFAKDAVHLIQKLGIMKGDDKNNFDPQKSITNAEVVTMLYRFDTTFLN